MTEPTSGALFGVPGLPKHGGLEHLAVTEDGWVATCPSCAQAHKVAAGTKAMAWAWLVAHISGRHG